ncbi:sensor histidine kinase [Neobacillus sp. DY30]|uniref:sensor histidine kinase n=1 Tax=Neobacillus sp. DY30 TaxID=3047871 RepID=UPI0024C0A14E|nr:sensor histidine kinase [Neobacillus sp. DY30]WHY00259.1 sensor histidine kinase [Neobacillus sp. DY30]
MLKFQHKLIIAFISFVLIPIIILGVVSYKISSTTLQKNISEQMIQTLKAVDRNLLAAVSEVNSFSDYVVSSTAIQDYLNTQNTSSIYEFYSNQQEIAGKMYGNSQIDNLVLYTNDGNVITYTDDRVTSLDTLRSSLFLDKVLQQKGRPVWLTPYENQNLFFSQDYILTQSRVVKDLNTLDNLGYLILQVKLDLFDPIFKDIYGGPSHELIVNKAGTVLYSLNRNFIGKTLDIQSFSEFPTNKSGYFTDEWDGEKSLITYMPSSFETGSNSQLILVSIKPLKTIASEVVNIRNTMLVVVGFTVLTAGLFNLLYLKRISRFIHELLIRMKQVESGRLSKRMGRFKFQELQNISQGFNNMIGKLQQLMSDIEIEQERKREAQFRVLQQQINPHFLYNTLESINALAALNGQREISKMTINLGKLLRISINGGYEVNVKDEIRHVISYLEIQKIRFNNRFSFEVDVEEELNNSPVLKLILQPLVENVLNHAFSNTDDEERLIKIRGRVSNSQGEFWIEDNGKGIDEHVLMELNQWKLENHHTQTSNGHGVRNVDERIRLFYGEKYGLIICSTKNEGTIIKISFPIKGD